LLEKSYIFLFFKQLILEHFSDPGPGGWEWDSLLQLSSSVEDLDFVATGASLARLIADGNVVLKLDLFEVVLDLILDIDLSYDIESHKGFCYLLADDFPSDCS
jgi:hypothetical protein